MPSRKSSEVDMWDVLVTITLMGFGAVALIAICALIGWAVFWMQNGGRDD
jgi:hypothetical protein